MIKIKKKECVWIAIVVAVFLCGMYCLVFERAPVAVDFRRSFLDSSTFVMQITNRKSDEPIFVELEAKNVEQEQNKKISFWIEPGKKKEIGFLEMRWVWLRGETYKISVDGYLLPVRGEVRY